MDRFLEKHIDTIDRIIKILIGLGFFFLGFYYETWWGALGLIPLLRGIFKPLSCFGDQFPTIDKKNQRCE
ncbi:MAG: DUF2892 domain-containing protein [Leptonema sp. (in: bacteria)]